jgi:hypothetical protein
MRTEFDVVHNLNPKTPAEGDHVAVKEMLVTGTEQARARADRRIDDRIIFGVP